MATVAVTVWGMLFWGLLYDPVGVFDTLPDSKAVAELLQRQGAQTGTYFHPWPRNTPETREAWVRQHTVGPLFRLSYVAAGVDPQSPGKIAFGVLHNLAVCLLAAALLRMALPALPSFARRAGLIVLAGAMGTLLIRVGDPVWYHMPWHSALGNALYEIVFWIISGAVLAAIIKPSAAR